MQKSKSNINLPNMITISSAAIAGAGCLSLFFWPIEISSNLGILAVSISIILDRIDGPIARSMGLSSNMGMQLDSLADLLAFCCLPMLITSAQLNTIGLPKIAIFLSGILYLCCGVWRLARYADDGLVDSKRGPSFTGVPTPVAGAASIVLFAAFQFFQFPGWVLLIGQLVLAVLMVSRVKYPKQGPGIWPWLILVPMAQAAAIDKLFT
jgi:CDP-diacylglycerol--serine O-phosphatidyltransferase